MTNRVLLGTLGGGSFGLRVSRPGYDVGAEPLGSKNIAFDSRLTDFGIIHQQGIWSWGGGTITFPTLPYIPLASILRIDSSGRIINEDMYAAANGSSLNWTTPFVAIVTTSTLTIRTLDNPWYTISPSATRWIYTIYAIDAV